VKRKVFTGILILCIIIYYFVSRPSYTTFSSNTAHVDFTFQYPSKWTRPIIFVSDNFTNTSLFGPMNIIINNYFNVSSEPSADAASIVREFINAYKDSQHFELFSNSELSLNGYTGQRAVVYYDTIDDSLNDSENNYVQWKTLVWAIPYNGKVYEIITSYKYEDFKTLWKDEEHFLETFRINN
jgi:hypothetical protein